MEINSDDMHMSVIKALADENAAIKVDLHRLLHIVDVLSTALEPTAEPSTEPEK